MNGIDVSKHNGTIDWKKVKASGNVDFAILRAGLGKFASQKDVNFEANYSGAKSAGIPVGAYWYCYAKTVDEARQEAKTCLECIKGKKFDFPIYYDIEEQSTFSTGINNVSAIADAFCEVLEDAGYFVGIYASRSAVQTYISTENQQKYALWVAEWGSTLHYSGDYGIWQYSETGKVDGIAGNVDLNQCNIDYPTVVKAAGKNGYAKPADTPTDTKRTVMYIPGITASDVQTYLAWIAEVGAGNYRDTAEDFKRFLGV